MSSKKDQSYEIFLESLKQAGVEIINERDMRERLGEVRQWREAFKTIARAGIRIGIAFKSRNGQVDQAGIHRAFRTYQLPEKTEEMFVANLDAII